MVAQSSIGTKGRGKRRFVPEAHRAQRSVNLVTDRPRGQARRQASCM